MSWDHFIRLRGRREDAEEQKLEHQRKVIQITHPNHFSTFV